jgi:hypothetical protein
MSLNPHDYPTAHRTAEQLRQLEHDDFWRGANAMWTHLVHDAGQRLARSSTRLQSALKRRQRATRPCG